MALSAKTALLMGLYCGLRAASQVAAPQPLAIAEAGRRTGANAEPEYAGQVARVEGIVSHKALALPTHSVLPIQDREYHGLFLSTTGREFESILPGDRVRATGVIGQELALLVLRITSIQVTGHGRPPSPLQLPLREAFDLRGYQGVLLATEGEVTAAGRNSAGDIIIIGGDAGVKVFLAGRAGSLRHIGRGDRVRVEGLASQYASQPPYDRNFEILIPSPRSVTLLGRSWLVPLPLAVAALLLIAALVAGSLFWLRKQARMRRRIQALTGAAEAVLGSASVGEIAARLGKTLRDILAVTGVRLLLYRKEDEALESVRTPDDPEAELIPLQPEEAAQGGAAVSFRTRAIFAESSSGTAARRVLGPRAARSLVYVPMLAREELYGVLEIRDEKRAWRLNHEESAAVQHLANHAATALKLMDQLRIREELARSEKLAAAGLLISSVVSDLRAPVESITHTAEHLSGRAVPADAADEISQIILESRRAAAIISRLAGFEWQRTEAQRVDLNRLLESVVASRSAEWRQSGITPRLALSLEPVSVVASAPQLEQVLSSLLRRTETSLAEGRQKWISVTARLLGRRVMVEIAASAPAEGEMAPSDALGIEICRGIVRSFGGELRTGGTGSSLRFEIELMPDGREPAAAESAPGADAAERQVHNILLVEPEPAQQRTLVLLLGERGHRVVPVATAEEAVDLAHRMSFNILIASVQLPGMNWLALFEKVRPLVDGFVLLTDTFDPPLAGKLGHILRRPVTPAALDRVIAEMERQFREEPEKRATRAAPPSA